MKTKIIIDFRVSEFNSLGTQSLSFKNVLTDNSEKTFKNILAKLNKNLAQKWESIEFEFKGDNILVCRYWLEESNFNWQESHQIEKKSN